MKPSRCLVLLPVVLSVVLGLPARLRAQAAPDARVLRVKAVADEAFRQNDKWEKEIREHLEWSDREFRKFAGLGLQLVATESWVTHRTDDMSLLLEELRHGVEKGEADIVVGFTGHEPESLMFTTGGFDPDDPYSTPTVHRIVFPHTLGMAMILGDRVVVRRNEDKKETRHTILHEIGHLFGGLHVRDKSILYTVAGPQDFVLDAFNQRVFALTRRRDFNVPIQDLPREELDRILALYRERPLKGERDFLNRLNIGYLLALTGRVDDAVREFEEAIKIDPRAAYGMLRGLLIPALDAALEEHGGSVESRYTLGRAYATVGQNNKAAQYLGANCFTSAPHALSCSELGALMVQNGALEQAERVLQRALDYDDEIANAHSNLGIVYGAQRRTEDALREFNRAVELAPDDARIHFNMGVTYLTLDLLDPAADSFRRALELSADYSEARSRLAVALARAGNFKDARDAIKPLEEKEVLDYGFIRFEMTKMTAKVSRDAAEVYFRAGDAKKAWKHLGEAKKGGVNVTELEQQMLAGTAKPREAKPSDLLDQAEAYFYNRRYDVARQLLEQARARDASKPEVHYWLARVARAEGKTDEAAARLQEALQVKEKYPQAHLEFARLHFERKDYSAALGSLQRYREVTDSPSSTAFYLTGACHYHLDNLAAAEENLKRAIQLDSEDGDSFYFLAAVYAKQKRTAEAISELNLAVGQRSLSTRHRPEAHYNLAVLYRDTEKYDLAWKHARIAERLGFSNTGWLLAELAKASPEPAAVAAEASPDSLSPRAERHPAAGSPFRISRAEVGDPVGVLRASQPIRGRVWVSRGPDFSGKAVVSLKLRAGNSPGWTWLFSYQALPAGFQERDFEVMFPWTPSLPSKGEIYASVVVVTPPAAGALPEAVSNEFPLELKVEP